MNKWTTATSVKMTFSSPGIGNVDVLVDTTYGSPYNRLMQAVCSAFGNGSSVIFGLRVPETPDKVLWLPLVDPYGSDNLAYLERLATILEVLGYDNQFNHHLDALFKTSSGRAYKLVGIEFTTGSAPVTSSEADDSSSGSASVADVDPFTSRRTTF